MKIAGTEEENRKKYLFELKKYRSYNKQKSFRALVLKICCESLDDTRESETGDIAFPPSTNPTEYSATDQTLGNIELERKCYTNKKNKYTYLYLLSCITRYTFNTAFA